jgi:hypothetical protein
VHAHVRVDPEPGEPLLKDGHDHDAAAHAQQAGQHAGERAGRDQTAGERGEETDAMICSMP